MDRISEALDVLRASLCPSIAVGGLWARSKIAHKWKAPFRSITLRECVYWRVLDLLTQAHLLYGAGHILGSRILIRSAIETLAVLIHVNQLTEKVLCGTLDFHVFSEKTSQMLLGSRDGVTGHTAINIMTILGHCDKRYPGIEKLYASLSESAHPNWEGICYGYSRIDHEEIETRFSNCWKELWADKHESLMHLVMSTFESEYNDVWTECFEKLEKWIESNDVHLEATKNGS